MHRSRVPLIRKQEEALSKAADARRSRAAWNCAKWNLQAKGDALSGTAHCAGDTRQRVTGTVRCLGAAAP